MQAVPQPANDPGEPVGTVRMANVWQFGSLAASIAALVFGGLYLGERDRSQGAVESLALARSQPDLDSSAIRVAQVIQADGDPLPTAIY